MLHVVLSCLVNGHHLFCTATDVRLQDVHIECSDLDFMQGMSLTS